MQGTISDSLRYLWDQEPRTVWERQSVSEDIKSSYSSEVRITSNTTRNAGSGKHHNQILGSSVIPRRRFDSDNSRMVNIDFNVSVLTNSKSTQCRDRMIERPATTELFHLLKFGFHLQKRCEKQDNLHLLRFGCHLQKRYEMQDNVPSFISTINYLRSTKEKKPNHLLYATTAPLISAHYYHQSIRYLRASEKEALKNVAFISLA